MVSTPRYSHPQLSYQRHVSLLHFLARVTHDGRQLHTEWNVVLSESLGQSCVQRSLNIIGRAYFWDTKSPGEFQSTQSYGLIARLKKKNDPRFRTKEGCTRKLYWTFWTRGFALKSVQKRSTDPCSVLDGLEFWISQSSILMVLFGFRPTVLYGRNGHCNAWKTFEMISPPW